MRDIANPSKILWQLQGSTACIVRLLRSTALAMQQLVSLCQSMRGLLTWRSL